MDPSLKETLLDRLSSYLDGLDAADAETAGLAPTAAEGPVGGRGDAGPFLGVRGARRRPQRGARAGAHR